MPPPYTEMARLNSEHEHQKLACQNMTDMLFILYFRNLHNLLSGTLTGVKTWTKFNDDPFIFTYHCNHKRLCFFNLIDKNIIKKRTSNRLKCIFNTCLKTVYRYLSTFSQFHVKNINISYSKLSKLHSLNQVDLAVFISTYCATYIFYLCSSKEKPFHNRNKSRSCKLRVRCHPVFAQLCKT